MAYGPAAPGDDYYRVHAPALLGPVADRHLAEALLRRWDAEAIAAIREAPQTVLWFDACLYDSMQAMRLLALLADADIDPARLWFIQAGATPKRGPIHGLGELASTELESLLPKAHRLNSAHLARARLVWQACAGADPRAIAAVMPAPDPGLFPHLDAALRRHLERFPAITDGLCALERHALRAIARVHGDFAAMFIFVKDQ
ncbi:MAG: hypothetical protein ACOCYP_10590 [Planctomycetota bacterium]